MKNIIDTALTIYLVGSPILTTILITLGLIQLNYNPKAKNSKLNVAIELIVVLYFGWWQLLKVLITDKEE